jgi:excisionase family DNA binding protein
VERRRCEPVKPAREPARRAPAEAPLVYTVAEVAERLKVSPGTVRNMIDQGQLYALRLHVRRIVVPKWALDELLARPSTVIELTRRASNA